MPTADERNGIFSRQSRRDQRSAHPPAFRRQPVPRNRFDPTAVKLLELWPQPNFTGSGTRNNFIRNPPWQVNRDNVDARVDHNVSGKDNIFGRVSIARFKSLRDSRFPEPARGGQNNDRAIDDNPARSVAFSYTRILRPTLLNEFRYGFVRQVVRQA